MYLSSSVLKRLVESLKMLNLVQIADLEEELEGPCLAVFCLATYGEGDPTDNAQEFFDWLQGGGGELNSKLRPPGLYNKHKRFSNVPKSRL